MEVTPTLGKGAPEDPVLPFCLLREHSKPRDGRTPLLEAHRLTLPGTSVNIYIVPTGRWATGAFPKAGWKYQAFSLSLQSLLALVQVEVAAADTKAP